MTTTAAEATIGQACSRILGVPERDIPDLDIWEYIGGACAQGAYCPRDRRDVPDVWDRFVVPVRAHEAACTGTDGLF